MNRRALLAGLTEWDGIRSGKGESGDTMWNTPRSSTRAGAGPDRVSADTVLTSVTPARDGSDAAIAGYGPPDAAIRQDPDAAAATLRQFTAWG